MPILYYQPCIEIVGKLGIDHRADIMEKQLKANIDVSCCPLLLRIANVRAGRLRRIKERLKYLQDGVIDPFGSKEVQLGGIQGRDQGLGMNRLYRLTIGVVDTVCMSGIK
ncbi:hypothetical protein Pmar_PMAR021132 [Perkinsus marinus ATCC 50983]|uniref:Uncharacterized protein n=1 Tax=Perkinsus marinus (strain ATCC 50983 / TXsc) TaxID=423536 RepID=C5KGH7_PERM5|nr:hypothetical protein Pmar_PMAR021132 [Perkinsus marinus ATCC 50983]EER16533.1 hypothetical protein Pmar_PMAR021132 [Perkinsus marinus ATCC 50983]|eukprot:XP_002784737.1 hypothetical protein Pmar_PMAR021132 [Perkinsus marinus ATCC 50983]